MTDPARDPEQRSQADRNFARVLGQRMIQLSWGIAIFGLAPLGAVATQLSEQERWIAGATSAGLVAWFALLLLRLRRQPFAGGVMLCVSELAFAITLFSWSVGPGELLGSVTRVGGVAHLILGILALCLMPRLLRLQRMLVEQPGFYEESGLAAQQQRFYGSVVVVILISWIAPWLRPIVE